MENKKQNHTKTIYSNNNNTNKNSNKKNNKRYWKVLPPKYGVIETTANSWSSKPSAYAHGFVDSKTKRKRIINEKAKIYRNLNNNSFVELKIKNQKRVHSLAQKKILKF